MRSLKESKKAVSPLIATVLLVVITIAIFGIIFSWIRGMVSEQIEKFGDPIEIACDKVAFTASMEGGNRIVVNNQGNIPILGLNIVVKKQGTTTVKNVRKPIDGIVSIGETDVIELESDISGAEKITVMPVIQGRSRQTAAPRRYVCKNKAVDI